jgi:hypothetical protein
MTYSNPTDHEKAFDSLRDIPLRRNQNITISSHGNHENDTHRSRESTELTSKTAHSMAIRLRKKRNLKES